MKRHFLVAGLTDQNLVFSKEEKPFSDLSEDERLVYFVITELLLETNNYFRYMISQNLCSSSEEIGLSRARDKVIKFLFLHSAFLYLIYAYIILISLKLIV